jgi:hypothetical protein
MKNCGRWILLPVIELSLEHNYWFDAEEKGSFTFSIEAKFLNRWCAIEFSLKKISNG